MKRRAGLYISKKTRQKPTQLLVSRAHQENAGKTIFGVDLLGNWRLFHGF